MLELVKIDSVRQEMESFRKEIASIISYTKLIEVKDRESAQRAIDAIARTKDLMEAIGLRKKEMCKIAKEYLLKISNISKELIDPLDTVKDLLVAKIDLWKAKEDEARKQKEIESQVFEESGTFEIALFDDNSKVSSANATAIDLISHTFALEDIKLVPLEYLTVDEKRVKFAIKNGIRTIPGLKIEQHTKTSIRRK
jgi:seryl-tRNA synthetase